MNSRHHNRVYNSRSVLRRWLAGAIASTRSPLEPRRLGCERLERRYALDGMGWFDESFQASEYQETSHRYGQSESGQNAIVRSLDRPGQMPAATQSRFHQDALDEDGAEVQVFDESLLNDLAEDDCERPRGMRGEGEGPGDLPARLGQRPGMGLSSRPLEASSAQPEPKLDSVQPVGNRTRGPLELNEPARPVQDHAIPGTAADASKPTLPSGSSDIPHFVVVVTNQARTGLIDALGTGDNIRLPTTTQNEHSSFASGAAVDLSSGGAIKGLNSNQTGAAVVSNAALLRTNGDSSSESSKSFSLNTVQIGDGSAHDRLAATTNLSTRTVTDSSSTVADTESAGLLKQLRSVIEKLASESQADKPETDSGNRLHSSRSSVQSGQFVSAHRKQIIVEDGMLELAAATDKLVSSSLIVGNGTSSNHAAQHRSQLLASLELHREFDLAGQATHAIENVVDPTQPLNYAQDAAKTVAQWSVQRSPSAGDSADQAQSSGSLWQRALLPLSFLAIGGILLKKKNRATQRCGDLSGHC